MHKELVLYMIMTTHTHRLSMVYCWKCVGKVDLYVGSLDRPAHWMPYRGFPDCTTQFADYFKHALYVCPIMYVHRIYSLQVHVYIVIPLMQQRRL